MFRKSQLAMALAITAATGSAYLASGLAAGANAPNGVLAAGSRLLQTRPVFQMPAGDHGADLASARVAPRAIPLRVPGAEVLNAAKGRAAALRAQVGNSSGVTSDAVKEANAAATSPTPLALTGACGTNVAAGFAPSDVNGAAGPTNLVVVTNVNIGVFNKTNCATISNVGLKTLFGGFSIPGTTILFDPRVLYDRKAQRFFVFADSEDFTNNDQFQYIAVSTSNLATAWFLYRVPLSQGTSRFCKKAVNSFWDYPIAGLNDKRLVITANDFGGGVSTGILDIDKTPMLSGLGTTARCFVTANGINNYAPAVVLDKSLSMTLLSPGSGGGNQIRRMTLANPGLIGADTMGSETFVNITPWVLTTNAFQPNGVQLDAIDGRFQGPSIQSRGLLWNVHTENGGLSNVYARWKLFKLATAATSVNALMEFKPTTGGSNNRDDLFNASVATGSGKFNAPIFVTASRTIDSIPGTGNAAHLIFSGFNSSANPAKWQFDTVGISTRQFTGCGGVCRWGDYSSTQIDPKSRKSDDDEDDDHSVDSSSTQNDPDSGIVRAWGFNQLVASGTGTTTNQFQWVTRAGKVELKFESSPTIASTEH